MKKITFAYRFWLIVLLFISSLILGDIITLEWKDVLLLGMTFGLILGLTSYYRQCQSATELREHQNIMSLIATQDAVVNGLSIRLRKCDDQDKKYFKKLLVEAADFQRGLSKGLQNQPGLAKMKSLAISTAMEATVDKALEEL